MKKTNIAFLFIGILGVSLCHYATAAIKPSVQSWVKQKLQAGGKMNATPSEKIKFLEPQLNASISSDEMVATVLSL